MPFRAVSSYAHIDILLASLVHYGQEHQYHSLCLMPVYRMLGAFVLILLCVALNLARPPHLSFSLHTPL